MPRVRDMLGDGGQEVGGGEDLEVAVDLGIEAGAVDHHVGRGLQRHFLHGEGIPQDVLGQGFEVGLGLGWHLLASVDIEATVFPGVEVMDPFGRKERVNAEGRMKNAELAERRRNQVLCILHSAFPLPGAGTLLDKPPRTRRSGGWQSATAGAFSDFWRGKLALVHPPA